MEQETANRADSGGSHYRAPGADPDAVQDLAKHLLSAGAPAIVIGDDVARAGAGNAVAELAEALGAPIWLEVIHQHRAVPSDHPNLRGVLPIDAASIAAAFGETDLVLLIGGPFFEEIWFSEGTPFPPGAAVLQIEESQERLSQNYALTAGLVGGLPTRCRKRHPLLTGRAPNGAASSSCHSRRRNRLPNGHVLKDRKTEDRCRWRWRWRCWPRPFQMAW